MMIKVALLVVISGAAASFNYTEYPGLNYDTWWGPKNATNDTSIVSYTVVFEDEMVKDLVSRLNGRRRFVPPLEGTAYDYGVNTDTFAFWPDYWANKYNFTERQAYMNQYDQYKTCIDGICLHYLHIIPEVPESKKKIVVLMLHGYPGSVREFYEAIPDIVAVNEERDYVVELVIPSLPGHGFSDAAVVPGMGAAEMALLFKKLMDRLEHDCFYIQGGDWGALIAAIMATFYPDAVCGYHTNLGFALNEKSFGLMFLGALLPELVISQNMSSRLYPLTDTMKYLMQETGYFHIQAAKPDTIGINIGDSPTGMFAWIAQLFSMASRRQNINETTGGLHMYTPEQLLDNAMLYWIDNKASTAVRLYAETFNLRNLNMGYLQRKVTVPTVVVQTLNEMVYMPPSMLKTKFENLLLVEPLDCCGHFFALEQPQLFAKSLHRGLKLMLEFNANNTCCI